MYYSVIDYGVLYKYTIHTNVVTSLITTDCTAVFHWCPWPYHWWWKTVWIYYTYWWMNRVNILYIRAWMCHSMRSTNFSCTLHNIIMTNILTNIAMYQSAIGLHILASSLIIAPLITDCSIWWACWIITS